jgi:hypothetical protein
MNAQDEFLKILMLPECADHIYSHLTRYSLKCLRLTCDDFDELVVSHLSDCTVCAGGGWDASVTLD